MTKPSRFLENGFAAACGGSFAVDSADKSEKRISDSALTEPSVPMQSAALASPRRIASTPSWIALAPEAQAVDTEIGEPLVPKRSARCSATDANRQRSWMAWKRPDALARKRSSYPTASLAPEPAASTSRCGHSISTGATARNSGPGKSPLLPMRASSMASSATIDAMRSPSSVEQNGSTGTKSTLPAIVVLRPSLAKRVMRWMPDSPAVSLAQLSAFPAPSEVMTPLPVTTTTGRPLLPRDDAIQASFTSPPRRAPYPRRASGPRR
jgi:hypothetical protein